MVVVFLIVLSIVSLAFGGIAGAKYILLRKRLREYAQRLVDLKYAKFLDRVQELNQREASVSFREKQIDIEYKNIRSSLQEQFDKSTRELDRLYNEKTKTLQKEYDTKTKELQKEYDDKSAADMRELDEAIEEQEKTLKTYITKVDNMIEDKVKSMTVENTLLFDCVCGNQNIPCYISLNKENSFRCEKCNSVYAVHAQYSPVLIGKASSEEEFNRIIENRLKEEEEEL